MAKKKKKKDPQEILSRAEELFAKKSYLQAKKEYERAKKAAGPGEIKTTCNQKIALCDQYLDKDQDKVWTKKGFKHLNKKELNNALLCFQKAYELNPEKWLKDKIEELNQGLKESNTLEYARQAEVEENFHKAAEFYATCYELSSQQKFLRKQALCLVKAQEYGQATDIYENLESDNKEVIYNHGYALACQGNHYACLNIWSKLTSQHPDFVAQKQQVANRLKTELIQDWNQGTYTAKDYQKIKEILKYDTSEEVLSLLKNFRLQWIKQNCQENNYSQVAEELISYAPCPSFEEIYLWGQIFFGAAEQTDCYLDKLSAYWLTAILNEYYLDNTYENQVDLDKFKQELYRQTEEIFQTWNQKGSEQAKTLLELWNKEKEISERFLALTQDILKEYNMVSTPSFADVCSLNTQIINILLESKSKQDINNRFELIHLGSYYSQARESLFLLEKNEHTQAFEKLPPKNKNQVEDEFLHYARVRIQFMYGLNCLSHNLPLPKQFIQTCLQAIDLNLGLEQEIFHLDTVDFNLTQLQNLERLLKQIRQHRPNKEIDALLSEIITERSINAYNQRLITDQHLKKFLEQALDLDPHNIHARNQLQNTYQDIEAEKVIELIGEGKFNKASQLAENSGYEEPKTVFFEQLNIFAQELSRQDMDPEIKEGLLQQMLESCRRLDPNHYLVQEITQNMTKTKL